MEEKKHEFVNWFLIRNFLMLLLFIAISELIINFLFTALLFPFLNNVLGGQLLSSNRDSGYTVVQLLTLMLWLFCSGLGQTLPGMFGIPFAYFSEQLAQSGSADAFQRISAQYGALFAFGIFCMLFLLVVIYLLPYGIAAFLYSRTISRHIAQLRREDAERREEFNRSRNLLLSDITHDLKTPITTISGYAQALNSGMVAPEKQAEYLAAISGKSLQMSRLVTLLFEYITLDSEDFKLKKKKENLTELVLETLAEHYSDLEEAGMELEVDVAEQAIFLKVDKLQLSRALENLLLNAVKHNPTGTKIKVSLKEDYDRILLVIADTGERIEEALIPHLFDPFVMGDKSRSSRSGSGLGLSIAAKVMELHDGVLKLKQPADDGYQKAFLLSFYKMTGGNNA